MNYGYQLGGLLDASNIPKIDFSRGSVAQALNEGGLSEPAGLKVTQYRAR